MDYPIDYTANSWGEFQAIRSAVFNHCDGIKIGGISASAKDTEFKYNLVCDRKLTKYQREALLHFVRGAAVMYRQLN